MTVREKPTGRNAAEWTTLIVSALVVTALIGVALYQHFAGEDRPGVWVEVELDLDQADRRGDFHYIPFSVRNDGAGAAADLAIAFTITRGETVVEESTVQIPFLGANDSAEGELVTELDPTTHTIEGRPATLITP